MFTALLICSLCFAESKTLAVQIELDRRGYSCGAIDGQWGRRSDSALRRFAETRPGESLPATPEEAYDRWFADAPEPLRIETLTASDLAALHPMPKSPAEKAKLPALGYATVQEMFAERGHLSRRAFERLNPGVDWSAPAAGLKLLVPDFPSIEATVSEGSRPRREKPRPTEATLVRVSLARYEIAAYSESGKLLALFPCSIAKDKAKVPRGDLKVVTLVPHPNYTYTPDFVRKGEKVSRCVLPPGPRNPVGVVWIGLNLPGFGMHGTPSPETIGRAESHGCFRLTNWDAARLFRLCRIGTRVEVE